MRSSHLRKSNIVLCELKQKHNMHTQLTEKIAQWIEKQQHHIMVLLARSIYIGLPPQRGEQDKALIPINQQSNFSPPKTPNESNFFWLIYIHVIRNPEAESLSIINIVAPRWKGEMTYDNTPFPLHVRFPLSKMSTWQTRPYTWTVCFSYQRTSTLYPQSGNSYVHWIHYVSIGLTKFHYQCTPHCPVRWVQWEV